MSDLLLEFDYKMGFPFLKIEGNLTVSNFTALHLVAKGATKFGTVPVIVDLSGPIRLSDSVKEIGCWKQTSGIPDYVTKVVLLVVSPLERLAELHTLLTPHDLQHASSVQEALDMLKGKTASS